MLGSILVVALAGEPAVSPSIAWEAPAECPQAGVVVERIERLLQRPLASDELALTGRVQPTEAGWSLQLHLVVAGVPDDRVLAAADCAVLGDTAALVAAVLLDPIATTETIDVAAVAGGSTPTPSRIDAPRARTKPPAKAGAAALEPPPRAARTRRRSPFGLWLRARGGGEYGAVPGGTGGVELAFAFGGRRVRGEILGQYWVGRRTDTGTDDLRVHLGSITPRVCGLGVLRPIDLVACGGVEIGVMRGDLADGTTAQPLWTAMSVEVGVRWPFTPRWSLWVSAMAAVPVRFPVFRREDPQDAENTQRVYRPATVGVRGLVGLEVRLRGLDKP